MAVPPVVDPLNNLQNESSAVATINANAQRAAEAIGKSLSTSDKTQNTMNVPLDMNGQRILNLPAASFDSDVMRKLDLKNAFLNLPGFLKGDQGEKGEKGDKGTPVGFIDALLNSNGTAEGDDAAITAAISLASSTGIKQVVFSRSFKVLTEHNIPSYLTLKGAHKAVECVPAAEIRSVFNVTGSSVTITDLTYNNDTTRYNNSLFIRVDKPHDDHPVNIERITAINCGVVILWLRGDKPVINDIYGLSTDLIFKCNSDGQNGFFSNLRVFGGHLLDINRDSSLSAYQMEGSTFIGLNGIQGIATYQNGVPAKPVIKLTCGLALRFLGTLIDQVTHVTGILLEGSLASPIADVTFHGTWSGGATPSTANVPMVAIHGIVFDTHFYGGEFQGSAHYGIEIYGADSLSCDSISLTGIKFTNNGIGDYYVGKCSHLAFQTCRFESNNNSQEASFSVVKASGCYYTQIPVRQANSSHEQTRGPGAFRGYPTAALSGPGLPSGNLYTNFPSDNLLHVN